MLIDLWTRKKKSKMMDKGLKASHHKSLELWEFLSLKALSLLGSLGLVYIGVEQDPL